MEMAELDRISIVGAIFGGNHWIREEMDAGGRQKEGDEDFEWTFV